MIRKQLYIEPHQEEALKRRSRELGVSEAELVRRALDAALAGDPATLRHPGQAHAAERLVATLDRIARTGAVAPEAYDREGLYAERVSALDRRRR
ncbi:MAG: hypothetical protein R6T93_10225 [Trueperaceae bacterium]